MLDRSLYRARMQLLKGVPSLGPRPNVFLPRPHPGWVRAAEAVHGELAERMGRDHGVTPTLWQREVSLWLSRQLEGTEVRVRMRTPGFAQFVREGRYTTQFERPGSSGGAKHLAVRTLIEHTVLGVPPDCAPADRPVYGYLSGSDESFAATLQQYGPVVLHLGRRVLARCTFLGADSLDYVVHAALTEPSLTPSPILRPRISALPAHAYFLAGHNPPSWSRIDIDPLQRNGFADLTPHHGYAEAQIHGGLRIEDLREVTITLGVQIDPQVLQLLQVAGVPCRATVESHP